MCHPVGKEKSIMSPLRLQHKDFFDDINLPLKILRREPQEPYPLHSHDFSELVIVFSGTGLHKIKDDEYPIGTGDTFVINPGQMHEYCELNDLVLVNILFDLNILDIPIDDLASITGFHSLFTVEPAYRSEDRLYNHLKLKSTQLDHVKNLVQDIENEIHFKQPGYIFFSKSIFMSLIGFLSRCYAGESMVYSNKILKIGKAISYVDENYSDNITINDLVSITQLSESTILRSFKKCFNCSPVHYINIKRIEKASWLLKNTDYSITDIAFTVGFSDSNYFTKKFKAIKHITPKEYRKFYDN